MPDRPLVSVVIVSWNAQRYLAGCLQSLKNDVYRGALEIIVVDNASSDGSAEMVERDHPEVTLIRNSANLGFAKANNVGLRRCRGEYVALVNSDVEVHPNCIDRLVEHLEANAGVGMVGPFIIGGDGLQQRSCRGAPQLWNMFCRALALDSILPRAPWFSGYLLRHWSHDSSQPVDILSGCFWLVRKSALEQVGLLDEAFFIYGEDMDWCKRFWSAGWQVVFLPGAQAVHYGGASSANAPVRFFVEKQRADAQYWAKHHSAVAFAAYIAISFLHHASRVVGYSLALLARPQDGSTLRHKIRRSAACLKWMTTAWRADARKSGLQA